MARFEYIAYDRGGGRVQGSVEANNPTDAKRLLSQDSLTPVRLNQIKEKALLTKSNRRGRVGLSELELVTAELSLLLDNGLKIHRALETLSRGNPNPRLRQMLGEMLGAVRQGETLAQAMAAQKEIFDPLHVNLVALGEASGRLPEVLQGLADDLAYRKALSGKVTQAMVYPGFIVAVCVLALGFIFNMIIPRLSVLFQGMEDLPVYTRMFLGVSDFMQEYQWFVLLGGGGGIVALVMLWQQPFMAPIRDDLFHRLPLLNTLMKQLERVRFSSALALGLENGLLLDEALRLARESVKNRHLRATLGNAREQVKRGVRLAEALAQTGLFPALFISLVEVGEESGSLAVIFREIAQRSRDDFEAWVTRFTTLLEPIMILFMALIVGSIVVVMLMSVASIQDVGF
ncbi:MAG: type II secretion system F family protein [Magnetococcales bacterium]|nr:type II secretion system F family protein [Magnetococcales bacterium]